MPALQQLVLFDSDPGIDDAMALAHLVCEPSINLKAVTSVFGNVDVTRATQNALNLLARWNGRHIPVFKGAHNPLVIPPLPPPAFIHGRNGLGNIELPHAARKAEAQDAPSAISRIARESNGKLRLIAVGPLTNLALALTLDPELVHHVHDVIVMGGSILEAGNINQWAEANFYNDPDAAAAVFAADWPVTMVGLDVTHQIMLSAQHLDQLAEAQPVIGEDLRAIAQLYLAFYRQRSGLDGCHMHDATAIAFLLRPDLFKGKEGRIEIIRTGVQAGRSILHPDRKARHTALVKVDHQACLQLWLDTIAASWLK